MGKLIKEEGEKGRLHIDTPLMGESLVSKELLARTESEDYFRMHPDINVLKIGGQSIMDRGAKVLMPILDELIKAKDKHKILLMTGGGTRARHVYNIGVDLGMPTGVLSKLGDKVSWQNAEMLSVLLAKHGGVKIGHGDNLEQLTMFCRLGYMPITYGIPPYGFFEHPAEHGSIPPHRTDCGAFLLAENIGARSLVFLKDEKGLFEKDPKKTGKKGTGKDPVLRPRIRERTHGSRLGRSHHRTPDPDPATTRPMPEGTPNHRRRSPSRTHFGGLGRRTRGDRYI